MTTNPHLISLAEAAQMTHAFQSATQFQGMTVACMMCTSSSSLGQVSNKTK